MELREMLAGYSDKKLPSIPKEFPVINVPKIQFTEVAPLFENLPSPHASMDIQTMEALNQGWGSILYRTKTPAVPTQSVLTITDAHDFAQVFILSLIHIFLPVRVCSKRHTGKACSFPKLCTS